MTESLPAGLPDRPPARVRPPAGGFPAAVAGARRRRRQRLGSAGSIGTAAVVLFLAVGLTGGGTQRLLTTEPAGPDSAAPAATPSGSPDDPSSSASAGPEASPAPLGAVSGSPDPGSAGTSGPSGPSGSPDPAPQATPAAESRPSPATDGSQQPAPPPEPRRGDPQTGPPSTRTTFDPTRACSGSGPTAAQGWCSYYDGALSARTGDTVTLATSVCRTPGQPTGTLRADSGEQAKFIVGVRRTASALWNWSTGRTFSPQGARLTVDGGTCIRWAVTWDLRADDGSALPAGSYYLEGLPQVVPDSETYVYNDNTETFTITN